MFNPLKVITEDQTEQPKPWYSKGLSFKCTECGQCCTGSPGYVWVSVKEIQQMADFLKLSIKDFNKKFIRKIGKRYSLIENPVTYDCVFLKDKRCMIYTSRPQQCKTFPWWPQNLESPKAWEEAASRCEGINKDTPAVPLEEIEAQLLKFNEI